MAVVTMTLYQALAKKKTLESQVEKMNTNIRMCGVKLKAKDEVTTDNMTTEEAKAAYQSGKDQTLSLFSNLVAIKAAINQANAITKVKISDKEYTIAEAIARYRMLDTEEKIYRRMQNNALGCKNKVDETNTKMLDPERISKYISGVLGDSKKSQELIDSTTKTYKEQYEVEFYDPLNTEELSSNKLLEIADFRELYHSALTEINCKTEITVEFVD